MKQQFIPNIITFFRFLLIIPIILTLLEEKYPLAFTFFLIAGLSDALDGFLARRFHWTSNLGATLDPLADKMLMLATYASLTWLNKIPLWLFIIVIGRDIWLMLGFMVYRYFIANLLIKPTPISKINTFFQLVLVIIILFDASFVKLPVFFTKASVYAVLITTLTSLFDYTWVFGKRAISTLRCRSL